VHTADDDSILKCEWQEVERVYILPQSSLLCLAGLKKRYMCALEVNAINPPNDSPAWLRREFTELSVDRTPFNVNVACIATHQRKGTGRGYLSSNSLWLHSAKQPPPFFILHYWTSRIAYPFMHCR
jgi:hypothetical protein